MSALLWPGEDRAGDLLTDAAVLAGLVRVESAWLAALVAAGIAPDAAEQDLTDLVGPADRADLGRAAEAGGNPVIPLVDRLRVRLGDGPARTWLHRGLTSQDVLDTALMLGAREAVGRVTIDLRTQIGILADLADRHRRTPMVARTLTQHAVPTTFGLKVAGWLTGLLDASDDVAGLVFPVQLGGAAGTLAGLVELAGPDRARAALAAAAERLGLAPAPPWHGTRTAITRIGDAAVRTTDAYGRVANDVLLLSRPEIGELSEGSGGGSSTMPHKANPVLATLVRRAALGAPDLAATLHRAAAEQVDERAAGPWHLEWSTLALLLRRTVVAAGQTTDLLRDLQVHPERTAATLAAAGAAVRSEQRSLAEVAGHAPDAGDYLGLTDELVQAVLDRAER